MVAGSFCVGQRLLFQEQPHRVFRDIGDGLILIEELTTGRIKEHRVEDLLRSWKTGELTIGDRTWKSAADEAHRKAIDNAHEDAFKQSYSALQQQQARAKLAFVQRLASAPRSDAMMTPLIDEIWADKKLWKDSWAFAAAPHFTSVARWIRRYYAANCDIRSLVPRNEEKGASNGRLDAIVQQIIDD